MAKKNKIPTYQIDENGPKVLLSEEGNTSYMLRKVSWNGRPSKFEIRKWHMSNTGDEIPGKGISFKDENTINELVEGLTESNYGNTETILKNIQNRNDFETALVNTIGQQKIIEARNTEVEITKEEYYDPRNLI